MLNIESLLSNEEIKKEYRNAFLLNMFKKICVKEAKSIDYKMHIRNLWNQTSKKDLVVKAIIKEEFGYELSSDELLDMVSWFTANINKSTARKPISIEIKKNLFKKQNGVCPSCGEPLGDEWSKIHVDHIIPWILVGDELEDNYQDLCDVCNQCKSSKIDYLFLKLLKLN